ADVELLTADWVGWYNQSRIMHRLGRRPPAEHEADYYALQAEQPAGDR
ncbi:IS3 family transposase, partial [Nocardia gipuzkoensis]|nr:IS3 family transposase [Nocardia gipuzkoensis]